MAICYSMTFSFVSNVNSFSWYVKSTGIFQSGCTQDQWSTVFKQMPTLKPIAHKGNLIQTTAVSCTPRVLCKPKGYHLARIQLLWEKQNGITQIMKGCTIYIFLTENILSLLSFGNPENRDIFLKYCSEGFILKRLFYKYSSFTSECP